MPCVSLGDVEVRRFRGRIRLVSRMPPIAARVVRHWRIPEPLALEHGGLAWESCTGGGLADTVRGVGLTVRIRGDDARWMRPPGMRGRSLKKRFQSLGIPPWERGRIPLVYSGRVLAAIGSVWINPRLAAPPGAPGWRVVWTPRPVTHRLERGVAAASRLVGKRSIRIAPQQITRHRERNFGP